MRRIEEAAKAVEAFSHWVPIHEAAERVLIQILSEQMKGGK